MGQLTRTQLIDEGLKLAGHTGLTTRAVVWLNAWLRSQYAGWPWPFLQKRVTAVTMNQAATYVRVGAGSGGVTAEIRRLMDPIYVYDSGYTTKAVMRIRSLMNGPVDFDETVNDPSTNTGLPDYAKVRAHSTWGAWDIIPNRVPDKNYLLAIDYIEQPADLSSGSAVPIYPNDRTLMKAVEVEALKYMKDPNYPNELQVLAAMTVDDRMKYGEVLGINNSVQLDSTVFR